MVSPPMGLCQENLPLSSVTLLRATYCTEYGHRIRSVHAVIWQAGTNWAGPVQIQIYYGPEWYVANIVANPTFVNLNIPKFITLYIVCKSKCGL